MTHQDADQPIGIELPTSLKAARRGAVAHLRLARSEKRNALDDVDGAGARGVLLPCSRRTSARSS